MMRTTTVEPGAPHSAALRERKQRGRAPRVAALLALTFAALLGCQDKQPEPGVRAKTAAQSSGPRQARSSTATALANAASATPATRAPVPDLPLRFEAPGRLVAIGDLHGDLEATRAALRLAGAIDAEDRWVGGDLTVVQTGDQLDRGDDEAEILELLEQLTAAARRSGGALHVLIGNHESMNAMGDFRYVTPGGFEDYASEPLSTGARARVERLPPQWRGRAAALLPGGRVALQLAQRNVVSIVGPTVFVHGGVLPAHLSYGLEKLNRETRRWLAGLAARPPEPMVTEDGPVWTRRYGGEDADCAALNQVLRALSVARMVIGHTVQKSGVSSACDGKVWRIDVGLARYYGGPVQVLEIDHGVVKPLRAQAGAATGETQAAGPTPGSP